VGGAFEIFEQPVIAAPALKVTAIDINALPYLLPIIVSLSPSLVGSINHPAAHRRFSASKNQNIAVDKRYETKVKVIVRNITPKARNCSFLRCSPQRAATDLRNSRPGASLCSCVFIA
jgi:hypothetical protein